MTEKPLTLTQVRPHMEKLQHMIQIELDRLKSHEKNLKRLRQPTSQSNSSELHREIVNSKNTLKQLETKLRKIPHLRQMCETSSMEQFDRHMYKIKTEAQTVINEFQNTYEHMHDSHRFVLQPEQTSAVSESSVLSYDDFLQNEIIRQIELEKSCEFLTEDVYSLNEIMQNLQHFVQEQNEPVTMIDASVETIQTNVDKASGELAKAVTWKVAFLPLGGAVLGCAVAGPIGLMLGAKMGACMGALGGAIVGATGGSWLKKTHLPNSVPL